MPPYINSSLTPYACIMEVLLNYRKGPQQQPQLSEDNKVLWFEFPLLSEAQERKVELCAIIGGYSVVLPGSEVTIHEAKDCSSAAKANSFAHSAKSLLNPCGFLG